MVKARIRSLHQTLPLPLRNYWKLLSAACQSHDCNHK